MQKDLQIHKLTSTHLHFAIACDDLFLYLT